MLTSDVALLLLDLSPYFVVNFGLVVAVIYGGYYAILDPIAGVRIKYKPTKGARGSFRTVLP